MNLAEVAIQKSTVTWFMTALLVFGGALSYMGLGRLEDPDFTIKQAVVVTPYPGATPLQVEEEVTDAIETEIQKMGELKLLESISREGVSLITVEIQDQYGKAELPAVWELLRRKVGDVQGELPPGALPSRVVDDFGDVFGVLFAITGDGFSQRELREHAEFLKRELLMVNDVAKIILWGEQSEAIYVEISRTRISELSLNLDQVFQTLQQQNVVVSSGYAAVGGEFIRIDPTGAIDAVEDIENLVVGNFGLGGERRLIYLRDIARISREYIDPPTYIARYNGQPAVAMGISTSPGGNVVAMGEAIKARIVELAVQTPIGLEVNVVSMQSDSVVIALDGFINSFLQAIGIVVVVLLLAMGLRTGLIIGAVLIVTVIGTFIIMQMFGVSLERISLGALIIALGMLVDNAIVVAEGMLVRIQNRMDPTEAAREVVDQTMWPLFGATAIAILAFAAIGMSQDNTGEFTRSLFQVMLFSLSLSWVLAITVTPLMCARFIPVPEAADGTEQDAVGSYDGRIFQSYRALLATAIRLRWATLGILMVMLGGAIYVFQQLDESFFPPSTRPQFLLHYWLPQGAAIAQTERDMATIEQRLLDDSRVSNVSSFIGGGAPRFILTYSPEKDSTSYGLALVTVNDYRDVDEMMKDYAAWLATAFPNAEPKLRKFQLGPSAENDIEVRFSGSDPAVLRGLSLAARAIMTSDPGTTGTRDNWRQPVKVLTPFFSEERARQIGVSRQELSRSLQANFIGLPVGLYREGDDLLPIMSRAPEQERLDIMSIQDLQIWSSNAGRAVPVTEVVSGFETRWMDAQIHRRDRQRTITTSTDARFELPSEVLARLMPLIDQIELPIGYEMEWGAEFENSQDAQAALMGSIPITILFMVLILVILFNSLRHPLIIWLTVPLAVIGVGVGLGLTGQPFNFMAILGFLSLIGLLIKNAIVLLDEIDIQRRAGLAPYEAILVAAVSRARPVAMAAATTVLGMLPLLFDPFYTAMAITIMAGLSFATVLTLIVIPVLYAVFFRVEAVPDAHAATS